MLELRPEHYLQYLDIRAEKENPSDPWKSEKRIPRTYTVHVEETVVDAIQEEANRDAFLQDHMWKHVKDQDSIAFRRDVYKLKKWHAARKKKKKKK